MRYVYRTKVVSVYERTEVKSRATGAVNAAGLKVYDLQTVHTGEWYVRISDSSAIYVGGERPDIAPGDHVCLTLEKVV